MYVVYGRVELYLPHSTSLKDKRQVIRSIVARIRKRFNISLGEVEHHDLWQRSGLGFAAVCTAYSESEPILRSISDTLLQHEDDCQVTSFTHQIIRCDD